MLKFRSFVNPSYLMDFKNYSKLFYEDKVAARHMYEYYKMQLQILCWGHGKAKSNPKWTSLNMFGEGGRAGGSHVTCDWPMVSRAMLTWGSPVNRMRETDTTENITFPQLRCLMVMLCCLSCSDWFDNILSHYFALGLKHTVWLDLFSANFFIDIS